jgi:hypothetical protein
VKIKIPNKSKNRLDLWIQIINQASPKNVAEIGVWKGDFAAQILSQCPSIQEYLMVDPWATLPDWNKPFNVSAEAFTEVYEEAMMQTEFASQKRVVLKGKTKDVIDEIEDESLDFVYIDGDHTLRGITMDLILILPKVRPGGLIAGDDFSLTPWQHSKKYEPTLVCPFAVYFAEAVNLPIHALRHKQFLIQKTCDGFSFNDTTHAYSDLGLNKHT